MCEYCKNELGNSTVTDVDNEFPAVIKKRFDKYYFDIEQCFEDDTRFVGAIYSFNYCPMCGRKLNENTSCM